MQLIVGLGNPGSNYTHTRHNVGFMFLEMLAKKYSCEWQSSNKLFSKVAKPSAINVLYAKPQTFMNNSGKAVKALLDYYNINTNNLSVVHDDLDIKIGEFKITQKSPKDHNGISSIRKYLKTDDFTKIRIGIDNRNSNNRTPGDKYVMGRFNEKEIQIIYSVFKNITL